MLFSGLDLVIAPGEVTGLVGANGAGKSTLLRILAGLERGGAGAGAYEAGSVSLSPPAATVGYLPQEPERRPEETVSDFIARRTGVATAQRDLDEATEALAAGQAGADDAYAESLERWLALGGADLDERAGQAAATVGLRVDLARPMTALSGGQAARANLAALLLSRYDIFLLDEPTNDLDIAGLEILEGFVGGLRAGTVLVSHDRAFLERTVHRVLELDLAQQQVRLFGGGYLAYLEEREIARQHARDAYEQYADTRAGLQQRMRTQVGWADKGVREARSKATDNDKHILQRQVARSEKLAGKVKATERMLDRLEAVEEPRKEWQLQMEITAAPRSGTVAAVLRSAVVERGAFRLGPVSLQVNWADRIAITGPNGSGKSTLIGALLGRVPLSSGQASLGAGVHIGEVDQARALFGDTTLGSTGPAGTGSADVRPDGPGLGNAGLGNAGLGGPGLGGPGLGGAAPLLDAFAAQVPGMLPAEVRTLLAKYGLKADHVMRPARSLSPGERTRAALALLQARGVNLLVLDEPTNHLDLPAIEQLEAALAEYPGTFLLVTHDRRMLEAVSVTRRLAVHDGQVTESGN
jgi:ATPase subunit of ABC transporter with duplicated ATPase domains